MKKELIELFIKENGLGKFNRKDLDLGMNLTVLEDETGDSLMLATPLGFVNTVAVSDKKGFERYYNRRKDITGKYVWIVLDERCYKYE